MLLACCFPKEAKLKKKTDQFQKIKEATNFQKQLKHLLSGIDIIQDNARNMPAWEWVQDNLKKLLACQLDLKSRMTPWTSDLLWKEMKEIKKECQPDMFVVEMKNIDNAGIIDSVTRGEKELNRLLAMHRAQNAKEP